MGETVSNFSPVVFDPFLFIIACYNAMHTILDEFELRLARTTDYGVSCP